MPNYIPLTGNSHEQQADVIDMQQFRPVYRAVAKKGVESLRVSIWSDPARQQTLLIKDKLVQAPVTPQEIPTTVEPAYNAADPTNNVVFLANQHELDERTEQQRMEEAARQEIKRIAS